MNLKNIKKNIGNWIKQDHKQKPQPAKIIPYEIHQMDWQVIDPEAVEIIKRLNAERFSAYVVGGGVRDFLANRSPKDFDIATDAKPEEVRAIFRRSYLVGRRFKIVHVRIKHQVHEVTTFRKHKRSLFSKAIAYKKGMLVRDNLYGTIQTDVLRRDFTVNALYYNIQNSSIIDFVGGFEDLKQGIIRMIGQTKKRFEEDPVRILRAIRIAAKLDFTLEQSIEKAIQKQHESLLQIAPERLFNELQKILLTGYAAPTFKRLENFDLIRLLFPELYLAMANSKRNKQFIENLLEASDRRFQTGKKCALSFMLASLLWPVFQHQHKKQFQNKKNTKKQAFDQAFSAVLASQISIISFPKKILDIIRKVWMLQGILQAKNTKKIDTTLAHRSFRMAYDLLLQRSRVYPELKPLVDWWKAQQQQQKHDTSS
jgi:poly(A) polymerase